MYEKIKSDINQEYYQNNYANDGQRFIAWYLRNIHNLDTYEAKDCITDGAGDKQIDAIYIDNQAGSIYIIQGKFYDGGTINADPLREVLSSWVQIKDLEHLQEGANQKLKVKINEMASALEDDYDICFELIITSDLTESANNDLEIFQKTLMEDDTLSANLNIVDSDTLEFKYNEALNKNRPYINYDFDLEDGKYTELMIGGTKAVIAAIQLKDCIKIPGIKEGSLFRKNVRQSLGTGNKVNKEIARTIKSDAGDFFFLHNGVTAICSHMEIQAGKLNVKDINVVNGCQSLNTIYASGETAKKAEDAYILFRFYEINDSDRADKISISTNSQSAVKARDLRSNDKAVLALKKAYEQYYTDGYFITKRGEKVNEAKYNTAHIVNLTDLGKQLMAWHSQRPTISYSETRIFDKYFDQLFRHEYSPQDVQALKEIYDAVYEKWGKDNPMGLNEALLAMKAYAPYHHLYSISLVFDAINSMPLDGNVPSPSVALEKMRDSGLMDKIIDITGRCLDRAMDTAKSEDENAGKIFVPQNWIKSKRSLSNIRLTIPPYFDALNMMPNGEEIFDQYKNGLGMKKEDFESRWTAD